MAPGAPRVARIVPDVTGLDKSFDYLVPDGMGHAALGDLVRVELHGRRVGGWVTELDPSDVPSGVTLRPLAKWSGRGPDETLVELARWAAQRFAACRLRPFLKAASPPRMVTVTPSGTEPSERAGGPRGAAVTLRLAPTADPLPWILEATAGRRSLVLHPSANAVGAIVRRLRAAGREAIAWPEGWERAAFATGEVIVVGTRAAAWARLAGLDAIVLLDEHDEAYQEERAPTWHAREVLAERARRSGATLTSISPYPTAAARALLSG